MLQLRGGGVGQEVGEGDLDTEQQNNDDACTDNFEVDTEEEWVYRYTATSNEIASYLSPKLVFNHTTALAWLGLCRTRYENMMIKPSIIPSRFIALVAGWAVIWSGA